MKLSCNWIKNIFQYSNTTIADTMQQVRTADIEKKIVRQEIKQIQYEFISKKNCNAIENYTFF